MCFMTLFSPFYWNCMLAYEKTVRVYVLIFTKWTAQYFSNKLLPVLILWYTNPTPVPQQLELTHLTTLITFIIQSLSNNFLHLFVIIVKMDERFIFPAFIKSNFGCSLPWIQRCLCSKLKYICYYSFYRIKYIFRNILCINSFMNLQPFIRPWPLLQFRNRIHSR
jgi:hypothetical protein